MVTTNEIKINVKKNYITGKEFYQNELSEIILLDDKAYLLIDTILCDLDKNPIKQFTINELNTLAYKVHKNFIKNLSYDMPVDIFNLSIEALSKTMEYTYYHCEIQIKLPIYFIDYINEYRLNPEIKILHDKKIDRYFLRFENNYLYYEIYDFQVNEYEIFEIPKNLNYKFSFIDSNQFLIRSNKTFKDLCGGEVNLVHLGIDF